MEISKRVRRGGLVAVTSLALTYVSNGVQTDWKGWESWSDFAMRLFVYWLALTLFCGFTAALIKTKGAWFTESDEKRIPEVEDLFTYVVFTVLVALVAIWVLAHWVPSDDYGDY